jgi:predicted lipase
VAGGESVCGAGKEDARVHSGFMRSLAASTLYMHVRAALQVELLRRRDAPLMLVGHSLGAALAALSAPWLQRDLAPHSIHLYTFGCPRTGNQARRFLRAAGAHQ